MKKSYSEVDVNNLFLTEAAKILTGFPPTLHMLFTELFTLAGLHGQYELADNLALAAKDGWRAGIAGEPSADLVHNLSAPAWQPSDLAWRYCHKGHALATEALNALLKRGHHINQNIKHTTP